MDKRSDNIVRQIVKQDDVAHKELKFLVELGENQYDEIYDIQ